MHCRSSLPVGPTKYKARRSPFPRSPPSAAGVGAAMASGFTTGSGKAIKISEAQLAKARTLLDSPPGAAAAGAAGPSGAPGPSGAAASFAPPSGFTTGGGKAINISEAQLAKARTLLESPPDASATGATGAAGHSGASSLAPPGGFRLAGRAAARDPAALARAGKDILASPPGHGAEAGPAPEPVAFVGFKTGNGARSGPTSDAIRARMAQFLEMDEAEPAAAPEARPAAVAANPRGRCSAGAPKAFITAAGDAVALGHGGLLGAPPQPPPPTQPPPPAHPPPPARAAAGGSSAAVPLAPHQRANQTSRSLTGRPTIKGFKRPRPSLEGAANTSAAEPTSVPRRTPTLSAVGPAAHGGPGGRRPSLGASERASSDMQPQQPGQPKRFVAPRAKPAALTTPAHASAVAKASRLSLGSGCPTLGPPSAPRTVTGAHRCVCSGQALTPLRQRGCPCCCSGCGGLLVPQGDLALHALSCLNSDPNEVLR